VTVDSRGLGWGTVQSRSGDAQSGVSYSLTDSDGNVTSGTTDANGQIIETLASGDYTLSVGGETVVVNVADGSDVKVLNESAPYVSLAKYGVSSGDNIDAALTSALAELGANGGRIVVPRGDFTINTPPSFKETRNITLEGAGGVTAGAAAATVITYTGTGSRAVDARSSFGFSIRDLMLLYNQPGFSGTLVDYSHSIAQDAAYMSHERVYFGGNGVRGAAKLLDLDKAISGSSRDCVFTDSRVAVYGRVSDASYSNKHSFDNCTFLRQTFQHIVNGGEAWAFDVCTFEPLFDGSAGAFTLEAGTSGANGLAFRSGWFGDAIASGDWINFGGEGLVVEGNTIGGGAVGVRLGVDSTVGVVIKGNTFTSLTYAIVIGGANQASFDITCNQWISVTNRLSMASIPAGSIIQGINSATDFDLFGLAVHATTVNDLAFPGQPPDGTIAIEDASGTRKICVRIGGSWYKATLT